MVQPLFTVEIREEVRFTEFRQRFDQAHIILAGIRFDDPNGAAVRRLFIGYVARPVLPFGAAHE